MAANKKQRQRQRRGVLVVLISPMKCDPFDAGIIGYMSFVQRSSASFKLPAACHIINIVKRLARERKSE